jgi:hypothetical protein
MYNLTLIPNSYRPLHSRKGKFFNQGGGEDETVRVLLAEISQETEMTGVNLYGPIV